MKTHYSKMRVGVVFMAFAMIFALFIARLVFVQVVKGAEYREKAQRQYLQSIELPAARGEIFDTRGRKVVINDCFSSLFAYPLDDLDVRKSYRELARIFQVSEKSIRRQYNLRPKKFCWIKRGVSPSEAARFDNGNKECGLFMQEEPTRTYPYGSIGRGVLGFVDLDNQGKSGVEMVMNEYLNGMTGRSIIQRDGLGTEYHIREVPLNKPVPGKAVVLTVDWDKQQIVEEELAKAVAKYHARAGMAIFLDPHTGAIIAAADYDPACSDEEKPMKLNAVTSTFEPGSVFKLVTAAAALESGRIRPSDSFDAEQGCWRLGRNTLRDDHKYGLLSFRSAFELSSNIAIGKIANEVGGDNVLAMAKKLGFGRKTRCGLNGESRGVIDRPTRWSTYVTSAFSIGHGVSVTALQMAQAFAVVAAGGYLNQPFIIKGCISDEGRVVEQHDSHPVKVLDDEVVKELAAFLKGVVSRGTGDQLADAPFAIAGKTGTAEKPNLETGGYNKRKFMASFAGYFPADSPLVAGIVVLDEPEPIHYGGYTSGPAFKNIALKFAALDKYDNASVASVRPLDDYATADARSIDDNMRMPDLTGESRDESRRRLEEMGMTVDFDGSGWRIASTNPCAGTYLQAGQKVLCYLTPDNATEKVMPNLSGLTMREAVALLETYGIPAELRGIGRVTEQTPRAGQILDGKTTAILICERSKGV